MPEFWSTLGNTIWWAFSFLILISYLMVLFSIIGDVFRDRELSGGAKALWVFCLASASDAYPAALPVTRPESW